MEEIRKVVQISTTNNTVYALTSDGLIFKYNPKGDWVGLPEIPTGDINEEKWNGRIDFRKLRIEID